MLSKLLQQALNAASGHRNTKLALVVRADLKMSKGKAAAQCAHAAVLCYQQASSSLAVEANNGKPALLAAWLHGGQPKIVLRIDDYEALIALQQQARHKGVIAELVRDAGRTQLDAGTATVLGLGPDATELIDELVGHLKLL